MPPFSKEYLGSSCLSIQGLIPACRLETSPQLTRNGLCLPSHTRDEKSRLVLPCVIVRPSTQIWVFHIELLTHLPTRGYHRKDKFCLCDHTRDQGKTALWRQRWTLNCFREECRIRRLYCSTCALLTMEYVIVTTMNDTGYRICRLNGIFF